MRHIKRGYNWFFTKIAAILGLFIGAEVFTINTASGWNSCTSSNVAQIGSDYTSQDGRKFKYCTGSNGWDWCNFKATDSSKWCNAVSYPRFYFFFMGCPSGYYANYAYGTQLTTAKANPSNLGAHLNTSTCNSKCYNTLSEITDWSTFTSATSTAERMVKCTSCPPYGEHNAKSNGTGLISTCYMSSATSYNDPSGSGVHTWASNCYYGN